MLLVRMTIEDVQEGNERGVGARRGEKAYE
jgi:hypothetical protein